ncbi:CLUMA_CG001420, isoform A [Clunio marinus]|uniref:CLUMA_CG001420, isoform A n=1 Tax=Clunio marinus TaxID=568069 RepID=A0A1J1HHV9_9DIPT|nr:CLUMA_CG001420, isoform A [Clunio marinus]
MLTFANSNKVQTIGCKFSLVSFYQANNSRVTTLNGVRRSKIFAVMMEDDNPRISKERNQ